MSKALVVLSGGQDSTTCLYWALNNYDEVEAITFHYGQRHEAEIGYARHQATDLGLPWHRVDLDPELLASASPLTSDNELEQYTDGDLPGGIEKTFVPMRNQTFLTIAANRAYALECDALVTGVCQADNGGYPDCRGTFITALERSFNLGTFTGEDGLRPALKIETPLMDLTKAQSIDLARNLDGCYNALARTLTAYDGQFPPRGHDHATVLRAKGFEEAGVADPLILRAAFLFDDFPLPNTPNYEIATRLFDADPKGGGSWSYFSDYLVAVEAEQDALV